MIDEWPPEVAEACRDIAPKHDPEEVLDRLIVKLYGDTVAIRVRMYGPGVLEDDRREIAIETLVERAALMDPRTH